MPTSSRSRDRPAFCAAVEDRVHRSHAEGEGADGLGAAASHQAALSLWRHCQHAVPPPQKEIKRLIQLATQTSLAATFVPGDAVLKRDAVSRSTGAVPVEFVFDKSEMTDLGRRMPDTGRLLAAIGRPPSWATLIPGQRCGQRQARCSAPIEALVAAGSGQQIRVKGLGRRHARSIRRRTTPQEQIRQMLRRVEIPLHGLAKLRPS